jgi:hypothetical protein
MAGFSAATVAPSDDDIKEYLEEDKRFSEEFNRQLALLRWEEARKREDDEIGGISIPYILPDYETAYRKRLKSCISRRIPDPDRGLALEKKVEIQQPVHRAPILEQAELNAVIAAFYQNAVSLDVRDIVT